ncbi:MAG: HAMP domain-containing histidine kinase [Deltaproteobacteria bacterium]|nr:HAMP domain-containing histidine kinase [Deltaproteobacteria bacterium]
MRNEQLAVRQKLSDVYRVQLVQSQKELQLYWQARALELDQQHLDGPASLRFAQQVREGWADSIIIYDPTGQPAYPAPSQAPDSDDLSTGLWRRIERLERSGKSIEAAAGYASIAEQASDRNGVARALQAQARCLAQAGETQDAISILVDKLSLREFSLATDTLGRLISPSAQLRALQLMEDPASPQFRGVVRALVQRLNDYNDTALSAPQRLFLMRQLEGLTVEVTHFDTLAAEQLAARYLASGPSSPSPRSLQPSGLQKTWHLASPSGALVALFEEHRLQQALQSIIDGQGIAEDAKVVLLAPGEEPQKEFLVSLPVGGFLQDWTLVLSSDDQSLFATAASQRINAYRLVGGLVVLVILLVAALAAWVTNRQLRLTRLKNDLLATVSHELKTPLASMRLLVDTLLESGVEDSQRASEYLRLIAKENVRLSRLVDNFLTFSRMDQNRQVFEKTRVLPEDVIQTATSLVSDRLGAPGCRFEVEVSPRLPAVLADPDALVTVLLNLLDNAYKYSREEKHIVLRAYRETGTLCLEVGDNGPGISSRAREKIFDRFYQEDQSLSRPGSGIGLGLSIVKFIIGAHQGSVEVKSSPGEGATFTVRLPFLVEAPEPKKRESQEGSF